MNRSHNELKQKGGLSGLMSAIIFLTIMLAVAVTLSSYASDEHGDSHDDGHGDEHGDEHGEHEAFDKGPHGGRLLSQGDISVELLLSGHGGSSGYEAWIRRGGEVLNDRNVSLEAQFVRLDGEVLRLGFEREGQSWHGTQPVEEPHSFDVTVMLATGGQRYDWTFGSYEGRVEIAAETAEKAGVKTELAEAGVINQTLTVYGTAMVDPANLSHLRARFPGTIVNINANIGETVRASQVMAVIESNQNLRTYELKSPMTGVVIARDGNPGELAQDQSLLTIANYDKLWVEFRIFPGQAKQVEAGQSVRVLGDQLQALSSIKSILPSEANQPFLRARVPLDNSQGQWAPGLMLSGSIATQQTDVPLRVRSTAIQQMDGKEVVFIHSGNAFEAREVVLGATDGVYTEVLSGLRSGVSYVSENSFLIRADLEKSGAAHNH